MKSATVRTVFIIDDDRGMRQAIQGSPEDGLQHRYLVGVAVDPADPDTVIVSATDGSKAGGGTIGTTHAPLACG